MDRDYDQMSVAQVADMLAEDARLASNRHVASKVRVGVNTVLGHAVSVAGSTWQHRWVSADVDAILHGLFTSPHSTEPGAKRERANHHVGLRALVKAGVVRPGLSLTLTARIASTVLAALEEDHGDDFDLVVAAASSYLQLRSDSVRQVRYGCAAMVMFSGKRLADITPDEWAVAERIRLQMVAARNQMITEAKAAGLDDDQQRRGFRQVFSLSTAYTGCLRAGLITPDPYPGPGKAALPPTLSRACRDALTLDNLLARHCTALPPRVRNLVHDVYAIEGPAMDNSTLKGHLVTINSYFRMLGEILPDHDSLEVPLDARDRFMRHIRYSDSLRRQPGTRRTSVGHFLSRVRTFYNSADWVVTEHDLTEHLPICASFPWSRRVINKISRNEAKHRESRLREQVLDQVHHLDGLVEAARLRLAEYDGLATAARAAKPGTTFLYNDQRYLRSKAVRAWHGTGRSIVTITGGGRGNYWDVDQEAYRAAQAHAMVVLLRESGLRVEEATELTLDNLIHLSDGDLTFPALSVNPSKMDRGRVITLHPNALAAIHDLVQRTKVLYGHHPLASRLDTHEEEDQRESHLIFFIFRSRQFAGVSRDAVQDWLERVRDYYNKHLNPGVPIGHVRPHQMRRMFTTDLGDRGADPVSIQAHLGHKSLSTTSVYLKKDIVTAISEVTWARGQTPSSRQNGVRDGEAAGRVGGPQDREPPGSGD